MKEVFQCFYFVKFEIKVEVIDAAGKEYECKREDDL